MTIINVFEYGRLIIDEKGFKREHWNAFVKLNDAHEGKFFEVLHNGLRFKQFVGVIQVDGLLIQIHPKADKDDADAKWRDVLLPMLKACGRIKAQTAGDANLNKQHLNLLEVYFAYFMREIEQLLHQGLVKKYRRQQLLRNSPLYRYARIHHPLGKIRLLKNNQRSILPFPECFDRFNHLFNHERLPLRMNRKSTRPPNLR